MPSIYDEPFAYARFANPADAAVQAMQPLWRAYADAGEQALRLWPARKTAAVAPIVEAVAKTTEAQVQAVETAATEAVEATATLVASDEPAVPEPTEPEIAPQPAPTEAPAIDPMPADAPSGPGAIPEPMQMSAEPAAEARPGLTKRERRARQAAVAEAGLSAD